MMRTLLVGLVLASGLLPPGLVAQDRTAARAAYPVGLGLSYGVGAYGLRDEAVSTEKYQGTLPYLGVSWARDHQRYIYRLELELRRSDEIRNHTVSTAITRFVLGQAFLYPVGTRSIMGRDAGFFLGPTTEVVLLNNEQHIAVDALGYGQSIAALLSVGVQADALVPVSRRITGLASLRASVISLGIRAVDDETDDEPPAKLLTPLSGTNASLEAGAIIRVTGRLSFRLAYLFQLGRITAWDPLLDASDSVVGRLSWRL